MRGRGDFAEAASLLEEVVAVTEATGARLAPYAAVSRRSPGTEAEATRLIEAGTKDARAPGKAGDQVAATGTGVLYNGLGRYEEALVAARQAGEHTPGWWRGWALGS